jgi:hypothetical protein
MWAELSIRTKSNLPQDLGHRLGKYFQDSLADQQGALEKTALEPELLPQILIARRTKGAITLVLSSDLQKIKVYIDNSVGSKTLEPLKREVEAVREDLNRFLPTCGTAIEELTVLIGAEGDTLFVGEYLGFIGRLKEAFKDHAVAKLYVPIATYLASLIVGLDQPKALLNVVTAIVALVLWVIIDAAFLRRAFAYKD